MTIEWTVYPIGAKIEVLVHGEDATMYWENGEIIRTFNDDDGEQGVVIKAYTPITSFVDVPYHMMDVAVRTRRD